MFGLLPMADRTGEILGIFQHSGKLEIPAVGDNAPAILCAGTPLRRAYVAVARLVKKFADDPQYAFPGHGQMKPEQLEIARLKREVTKLKAERDILKKAAAYFAKELT